MNNKLKLAVAGAILASASVASAGIIIPAGDWTVDINGNVNAFAIMADNKDTVTTAGAMTNSRGNGDAVSINTGLLPSWFGVTASTRTNDLDVSWTISTQPGSSSGSALGGGGGEEARQASLTFGDKSWGSVLVGKNLGIFGSDAILSDMTLLGVGSQGVVGSAGGTTTTLGRIGTGYLYADWMGQISYTTPNMNGFQVTAGIFQPWNTNNAGASTISGVSSGVQDEFGYQGKAVYSWGGDMAGKVWAGFFHQKVTNIDGSTTSDVENDADALEFGFSISSGNTSLVGYIYDGEGVGTTAFLRDGFDAAGQQRDSDGGYVQATYVIPSGTKIGVSYGESNMDATTDDSTNTDVVKSNEMWTVGAYHPLTKHLNLVAEYSSVDTSSLSTTIADTESEIVSVGAILFF